MKLQVDFAYRKEMVEIRPSPRSSLLCGIITGREERAAEAERRLGERFVGWPRPAGLLSLLAGTAYYQEERDRA